MKILLLILALTGSLLSQDVKVLGLDSTSRLSILSLPGSKLTVPPDASTPPAVILPATGPTTWLLPPEVTITSPQSITICGSCTVAAPRGRQVIVPQLQFGPAGIVIGVSLLYVVYTYTTPCTITFSGSPTIRVSVSDGSLGTQAGQFLAAITPAVTSSATGNCSVVTSAQFVGSPLAIYGNGILQNQTAF